MSEVDEERPGLARGVPASSSRSAPIGVAQQP